MEHIICVVVNVVPFGGRSTIQLFIAKRVCLEELYCLSKP
jgi:hypothetical protein